MKFIKNNVDTIMLIVITSVLVMSVSVFAVYKYYAKDVAFTLSKEEWKTDNVNSALNDLYTNKDEVIPGKDNTITEQQKTTEGLNTTLSTLNTSLASKNKTISDNETTITNLNTQNTSLLNSLANLDNGNCISGTYVFEESCGTSTGCKILDFSPDIFAMYTTSNSTYNQELVWYYNKDISRLYVVYGIKGSTDWTRQNMSITDRTISSTNSFSFANMGDRVIGETVYYIACA